MQVETIKTHGSELRGQGAQGSSKRCLDRLKTHTQRCTGERLGHTLFQTRFLHS